MSKPGRSQRVEAGLAASLGRKPRGKPEHPVPESKACPKAAGDTSEDSASAAGLSRAKEGPSEVEGRMWVVPWTE